MTEHNAWNFGTADAAHVTMPPAGDSTSSHVETQAEARILELTLHAFALLDAIAQTAPAHWPPNRLAA
ncbi:MAG TPA: hypothetical protein VMX97_00760 [Hyphomicrobiaceae bacterium]|nr:hypothetical protein [Hyphomicrobiaceae bacterium]